jgi:6-pyruvoyltetrahydropterin/6-carboxytetrahydropterin synthase
MGKFQSTKVFSNYSVALRQWRAQHSHCQLLHGYALKFKVWFEAEDTSNNDGLDEMNWIVDYGGFKDTDAEPTPGNGLKKWMNDMWDHTLLIEKEDPQLETFTYLQELGLAKLVVLDKMGAESCAKLVYDHFNKRLALTDGGRCKVTKVECWENDTNSSTYVE